MKKNQIFPTVILLSSLLAGCSYHDGIYSNAIASDGIKSNETFISDEEPQGGDRFNEIIDNPFVNTSDEPVSTFSVDADGAAYGIMRKYVNMGYTVDKSSVRIEEYLNYFTFDYPAPTDNHSVAINGEVGICPWNVEHRLLRLGIKGKSLAAGDMPRANFVFLIDVSGSMDSEDKIELLKSGLIELTDQLNPDDRISIITYSGEVKKLLESTRAKDAHVIKNAIRKLSASGSTAGGKALEMAYKEALANYIIGGNNRVIMGTDGDFNVGVTTTDSLVSMVERYARQGIYMTCCGFGSGNLNDAMMEKISNSGNGTYNYIDCEKEMMKVFVNERERFCAVANDAKCQVTFDSTLVSAYRLIGYENRVMSNEDFTDDTKDAGEIGAGQTITALYEVVPTEWFDQCVVDSKTNRHVFATFDFRYKKSLSDASLPLQLTIAREDMYDSSLKLLPTSENFRFAAGVASYGMVLRDSPYKGDATLQSAIELVRNARTFDPHGYREELETLMIKYGKMNNKQ
jgi:Ca-activated chloride channel family protein